MPSRLELVDLIKTRAQDKDDVLLEHEFDDALEEALQEYSERRPQKRIYDIAGDGTTVLFALPLDWQDGWSELRQVESLQGESPLTLLERSTYAVYRDTSDVLKLLFDTAPESGTSRVLYTTVHTADLTTTTIPSVHERALVTLGAAIASQWIANHYTAESDSTFGADTADHTGRSERYETRSKELRKRFDNVVPEKPLFMRPKVVRA